MSDENGNLSPSEMNEIRERIIALQRSASNMVQMDLDELSALLPPDTSRDRLMEIRSKLIQLHALQNGREVAPENENLNSAAEGVTMRSSRYKTELCRPYEENGVCKYGARCQFAHGVAELRNLARHPKYKSQLCRTFHSNGLCPYGHRCHFIHNQDEVQGAVPPRPLSAQANPVVNNYNVNQALRARTYTGSFSNEWNHPAGSSNLLNENFRAPLINSSMQALMPNASGLANVQIQTGAPVVNNFKPQASGSSLGSAGELSPPVSPIIYSPDDPFSSQAATRPGHSPSGVPGEGSELNLNQMLASGGSSFPVVGSWPRSNFYPGRTPFLRSSSQPPSMPMWWNDQK